MEVVKSDVKCTYTYDKKPHQYVSQYAFAQSNNVQNLAPLNYRLVKTQGDIYHPIHRGFLENADLDYMVQSIAEQMLKDIQLIALKENANLVCMHYDISDGQIADMIEGKLYNYLVLFKDRFKFKNQQGRWVKYTISYEKSHNLIRNKQTPF
jgi:hypothetical protein